VNGWKNFICTASSRDTGSGRGNCDPRNAASIWHVPADHFRRGFFLFANIASLLRGKWRDFLLVVTSLAFGIFLIEAAANIWEPREPTVVGQDGLFALRPVTGWGPVHAGRYHVEKTDPKTGAAIYSADYTIDSNLVRQTLSCEKGPAVVFFGCSYTFGLGLNDGETLPQAFADSLGRKQRVLNLGYPAYGPQQFLSELQAGVFDSVIGPQPRVFVFLTSAWHAERSACKPYWMSYAARYKIEDGQLLLKGACYEGLAYGCKVGSRVRLLTAG
jgi:hypothetical protein